MLLSHVLLCDSNLRVIKDFMSEWADLLNKNFISNHLNIDIVQGGDFINGDGTGNTCNVGSFLNP